MSVNRNPPGGHIEEARDERNQGALARSARSDQRQDLSCLHFQVDVAKDFALAFTRLVEKANILKADGLRERRQRRSPGLLLHFIAGVHELKNFRRSAEGLLEGVMEHRELTYRVVKVEQRNDQRYKNSGRHPAMNDLLAAKQQKKGNGNCTENVPQRRTDGRSCNGAQIGTEQTLRGFAEAGELPGLHAEGFHNAVAGDGLMKNVLDIGQLVLAPAGGAPHAHTDLGGGKNDEGYKQQQQPGQPPPQHDHNTGGKHKSEELLQEFRHYAGHG